MKNLLLFTLILASKFLGACGFYPYGEDTRISLFNPHIFGFYSYDEFNYSSNLFETYGFETIKYPADYVHPNTQLWFDYCGGKVEMSSVDAAVYTLTEAEMDESSPNAMIQYLYQRKDIDALNYLRFAKSLEYFNSWQDDPWEREEFVAMPKRTELMNRALNLSQKVPNQDLKRRYTFLAMRLAWYNHDFDKVKSFFNSTFEKSTRKDIIYYWSLYFKSTIEKDSALANFGLAQVFAHAIDKRFVCHQHFYQRIPIERTLQFAKTEEEKANVYLLSGIEKYDKALPYLQKIYEQNPTSDGLSFLLLREVNKIEDFVFTPYYTLFQPTLSYDFWENEGGTLSVQQTLSRSELDRNYAKQVLQFVNSVDLKKVHNPFFWQSCKAYLLFVSKEYQSCLVLINQLEKLTQDKLLLNQLQIVKSLALTAKQSRGKAVIPTEAQATLMDNSQNLQFMFAIGKELEYLGNTTDAALLYSKQDGTWYEESSEFGRQTVFWKTLKTKKRSYADFFVDCMDYVDAVYTPEQTQDLIDDIQKNKNEISRFSMFKYGIFKDQVPRLYDLLGTKYIRQNKLENALVAFGKAGNQYWNRAYTSWEDNSNIFDQNPFYTLKYTPKFIETADTIRLNKFTITKQLIHYLQKAEDQKEKDRDYYYFLVANAYYNMGHEGNVFMMRRFSGWSNQSLSVIEDETEFRQSNLAKQYYLLAKQYAQTDKFRALCLRMAVRCEKNKIDYQYIGVWDDNTYDAALAANTYYLGLNAKYPDYFEDLVSTCDNFGAYFKARR